MKQAIIVADDSQLVRNIIFKSIGNEYVILNASNGKEAINQIIVNNQYDIIGILLDLNMPEYDGFMVLDYLKENELVNKYPVVIISGDDSKETIDRAFSYGIIDLLSKPFSTENIKNVIIKMNYNK